jgi:nucleotide-binding universal stress UspA family protein
MQLPGRRATISSMLVARTSAHRIVVGYDGTASAQRALDRAAALAGYGAEITVVHVAPDATALAEGRRLLDEASARLRADTGHGPARVRERVGDPVGELVEAAVDHEADFVVVGDDRTNSGREVASGLLDRAPCDVLVVR